MPPAQDFERERNPERVLQSMSLKRFAALVFRECPGLAPFAGLAGQDLQGLRGITNRRAWPQG